MRINPSVILNEPKASEGSDFPMAMPESVEIGFFVAGQVIIPIDRVQIYGKLVMYKKGMKVTLEITYDI